MKSDLDHARSIMRGIIPVAYFRSVLEVNDALTHTVKEVRLQKRLTLVVGFCAGFGTAGILFAVGTLLLRS